MLFHDTLADKINNHCGIACFCCNVQVTGQEEDERATLDGLHLQGREMDKRPLIWEIPKGFKLEEEEETL